MAKDLYDPDFEEIDRIIDQLVQENVKHKKTIIDYKDDDAETEAAIYTLDRLASEREKAKAEADSNADKED